MKRNKHKAFRVMIATWLFISAWMAAEPESRAVDDLGKILDFSLKDVKGETVSLNDFQGKRMLINFWATWCVPCVTEMTILQEIYDQWIEKGLVVISINMGESESKVRGFVQRHGLSFPVLLDPNTQVFIRNEIRELPTTLLVDKDKTIIAKKVGLFLSKESLETELLRPAFGKGTP
jgi:peroxiredoxin